MTLHPPALLLGLLAGAATLFGGGVALRARGRLGPIVGIGAGVVFGVALLELLPEALELAKPSTGMLRVMPFISGGAYLAVGALLDAASHGTRRLRRQLGPAMLTLHSLIDGAGIGLAFQVSSELGWGVAIAVLSHDLADGVNVVGLSLSRSDAAVARRWLGLNALAPLAGATIGQLLHLPDGWLAFLLAGLAGIFVAIAAGEMLPRAIGRSGVRTAATSAAIGFTAIVLATRFHG